MATVALQALEMVALQYVEGQIMAGLAPAQGPRKVPVTGASYNTAMPLVFGQGRVSAEVIWSLPLQRYTRTGKYRGYWAVVLCICPQITPGGAHGASVHNYWMNGIRHYSDDPTF